MLQIWPSPTGSHLAVLWYHWAVQQFAGRVCHVLTVFDMLNAEIQNGVDLVSLETLQWAPSGKCLAALIQRNPYTLLELFILEGQETKCMSFSYAPAGLVRAVDPDRGSFMLSWSPQETILMIASWVLPFEGFSIDTIARGSFALLDMNTKALVTDGPWTRNINIGLWDPEAPLQVFAHRLCC